MDTRLSYYLDSDTLINSEKPIYLNKVYENSEGHLHAHDFIEIAYVVSGCGTHCIGENEYEVSKGDLFIINYDIPHEFRSFADSSKPKLWVYNCIFKSEFLDSTLINSKNFYDITQHFLFKAIFPKENNASNNVKLINKGSQIIEELYEKMFMEYKLQEEGYIEILRAYVIELLVTIFRLYKKNNELIENLDIHRQEILSTIKKYIKENYFKEFKLEDLSAVVFLSPNYLSRLFKECTNMTVTEYIQKIRIEEACQLLRGTDKKVIDIVFQVGYKDIKYFNEIFKKKNGKTPREYRNMNVKRTDTCA